jgi:3-oxoacyl-[acyl-carrier protein] reductase
MGLFDERSTIMTNLSGKTALVTGASRGIGRATALVLGKVGARVLVHYCRAAREADAVVNQIKSEGGRANAIAADLATADGPQKLASDVRQIVEDRLDILLANAGISKLAPIEEMTIQDFDSLFAVNVRAPYFLVQQLLPSLGAGSSVVFLSSAATHAAVSNLPAYAGTKEAVDTLARYFAFILGQYGIHMNAVVPA